METTADMTEDRSRRGRAAKTPTKHLLGAYPAQSNLKKLVCWMLRPQQDEGVVLAVDISPTRAQGCRTLAVRLGPVWVFRFECQEDMVRGRIPSLEAPGVLRRASSQKLGFAERLRLVAALCLSDDRDSGVD